MAPKNRHKKFLRAEKAKTKLKGARLPKGLNVTKTEFKVRKIVIPEQLAEKNLNQALSSKKLSVKECLTKLQHNNSSHRIDGLKNLQEIIQTNLAEVLEKHLGAILHALASMALDIDRDTRREGFKTLSFLLSAVPTPAIEPFFDALNSFLRCAMTHIQQGVQEDSLLMLDTLLLHIPSLVAANSDKIFSCFLDMISKLRVESRPERTLTVNMSGKMTSVRWRMKVLDRLHSMLGAVIRERKGQDGNEDSAKGRTIAFKPIGRNFYPILRTFYLNSMTILFSKSAAGPDCLQEVDEGGKIRSYVQMVMPLMWETWLEVRPTIDEALGFNVGISTEAAASLKVVLEVILQLWTLVCIWERESGIDELSEWFRNEFREPFIVHFLLGFPFNQIEGGPKKRDSSRKIEAAGGLKCSSQNLNIAQLFFIFNRKLSKNDEKNMNRIIKYLKNCISKWPSSPENAASLAQTLRLALVECDLSWVNNDTKGLLKTLIQAFTAEERLNQDARTKVLLLLCELIMNDQLWKAFGPEMFNECIKIFPDLLLSTSVNHHTLVAFSELGKRNNKHLIAAMEAKFKEILGNLGKIEIRGSNTAQDKFLIVNLFFWSQNQTKLNEIAVFVKDNRSILGDDLADYAIESIQLRLEMLRKN